MAADTFATRLKALREQAGLTQTQLAEKAGMHHLGIAKLEQGLREPTWDTVQKLCNALGVACVVFEGTISGRVAEPAKRRTSPEDKPKRGRPKKPAADAPAALPAEEKPAGKKARKKGGSK